MDADTRGFKHQDLTKKIIGVFYEVYNELGVDANGLVAQGSLSSPAVLQAVEKPQGQKRALRYSRGGDEQCRVERIARAWG